VLRQAQHDNKGASCFDKLSMTRFFHTSTSSV
jgi:hypothetical protein